ncbi:glycosyltransferase family 4 protein [Escherichia coli]|uniref:glycosyltransferase family 4 protein n=1 Tax=Escherichia coli TaxID=562 RepID=UPI002FC886F5
MSNIDINKKQILVLTPRFPFPVIGGDRLRIYKICKELSKHYDLTLLSLCDKREELNYEYDREVFSSVHRVYLSKKKSILNVIFSLFSNTPLQIGYYKSKEFEDKLKQLLPEHSATLSHLIRVGDYVKENKDINFLEMTDAISLNYKRVKEKASLLSLKTFVYSFEQKRLERYERTINNKFSLTTLVSQVDSDYLYPDRPNNVLVCGNGVDAVSLPFSERKIAKDKKITLVFIGNLYSLQNMDGVRWFTKEVLPFLNKHGNFEFKVIGRITDKDKSWLESQPGVVVTGEVDSITYAAADGHIGVCSISLGAGIQNKVLEYMALGLPCISSTVGFEGLGAEEGKEIYVANTKEEYLRVLNYFITNLDKYTETALVAKKFIGENFSWEAKLSPYIQKIKESVK